MAVYLITGGAGFIGSNLTQALLGDGHSVRVLDDFSTGRRENLEPAPSWARDGGGSFELHEGDVRDTETCRRAVRGVDYVLHQAAIPSVQRSVDDPLTTNQVNVFGTLNMLQCSRVEGVRRFVFASSSSLYGENEVLPKVETMAPAPISPYGLQKLAAEAYCGLYHRLYGLATVALRYFNVFGPRQDPSSDYAAVVPRFISAIKRGARPTIYGDGEQTRDFTFIGNVIQANLRACQANAGALGGAFNIACGERTSLNRLVELIAGLCGADVRAEFAEPRRGDIRHSLASIEAARQHLQYAPDVDLREGLRRTLEAY